MPKIVTIACNMKGCLRFCNFILWTVPNLVKYTYGWSSLEQYGKIGKKKSGATPLTWVPAIKGGGYNIPILGLSKPSWN